MSGRLRTPHIEVDGDGATCDSRLTASLHFGADTEGTISVRAIWYRDKLRRAGERRVIHERRHELQWRYDAPASLFSLTYFCDAGSALKTSGGSTAETAIGTVSPDL